MRDTGREALEAGLFAHVLENYVIKRAFGRERPDESNGRTVFVPGSSHDSFPSGHATEAFAVASVVAARSKSWIIPSLAYAAATVVAMDRVNSRLHFASDVVAGAFLGTAMGHYLVHRHHQEEAGVLSKAEVARSFRLDAAWRLAFASDTPVSGRIGENREASFARAEIKRFTWSIRN